jgi:ABC-type phosphate transport system auxiliary subunit
MVDPLDHRGVPVTSGIPVMVRVAATVGLIMIFVMGALVVVTSKANHCWPSKNSTTITLAVGAAVNECGKGFPYW